MKLIHQYQNNLNTIYTDIVQDPANRAFYDKGWDPLYFISPYARIIIIGQAPGIKAQERKTAWDDASGDRLRNWLGVSKETFYDDKILVLFRWIFIILAKGKAETFLPDQILLRNGTHAFLKIHQTSF